MHTCGPRHCCAAQLSFAGPSAQVCSHLCCRYGYPIRCTSFSKDAAGNVTELAAEYDADFKTQNKKPPKVRSVVWLHIKLSLLLWGLELVLLPCFSVSISRRCWSFGSQVSNNTTAKCQPCLPCWFAGCAELGGRHGARQAAAPHRASAVRCALQVLLPSLAAGKPLCVVASAAQNAALCSRQHSASLETLHVKSRPVQHLTQ